MSLREEFQIFLPNGWHKKGAGFTVWLTHTGWPWLVSNPPCLLLFADLPPHLAASGLSFIMLHAILYLRHSRATPFVFTIGIKLLSAAWKTLLIPPLYKTACYFLSPCSLIQSHNQTGMYWGVDIFQPVPQALGQYPSWQCIEHDLITQGNVFLALGLLSLPVTPSSLTR